MITMIHFVPVSISGDEADNDDSDECVLDPSDEEISFPKKSPNNKTSTHGTIKTGNVKADAKPRRGRPRKVQVISSDNEKRFSSAEEVEVGKQNTNEPSKWAPPT